MGVSGQQHAPTALYPRENLVPIVQEAGWEPGPVRTAENIAPPGFDPLDRPARSQSLYRLSYLAHQHSTVFNPIYINMQSFCSLLHTSGLKANTLWHGYRALVQGYTNPGRQNFCTVGPRFLGNFWTPAVFSMYGSHGCYSDVWVLWQFSIVV
jgi:hypothetical protein